MRSPELKASPLQKELLAEISRQFTSSVREVERSKILLAILSGYSNTRIEEELGYSWEKAKRWRYRWLKFQPVLDKIESSGDKKPIRYELEKKIRECLGDAARPGGPSKFTAHDYCQILGVALEDPGLSERPISHWSMSELKDEVEKRGIVTSISRAQVGSFLKRKRGETAQNGGLDEPQV